MEILEKYKLTLIVQKELPPNKREFLHKIKEINQVVVVKKILLIKKNKENQIVKKKSPIIKLARIPPNQNLFNKIAEILHLP